jgi:hypothetical protein
MKLRYALAQNVCPFCGDGILSKSDFVFRKAIAGILKSHGIVDGQKAFDIISDIELLIGGDEPEAPKVKVATGTAPVDAEDGKVVLDGVEIDVPTGDEEEVDATPEEKAEVEKMIESGEMVMAGVMSTGPKKKAPKGKYIPKPISSPGG